MIFLESFLLFCSIFICLRALILNKGGFMYFVSPAIWNLWFSCNIVFIFCLVQLPIPFLFKIFCAGLPLVLTGLLQAFLSFKWQEGFLCQLEFFLNILVAQIRIGQGFRVAFKSAVLSLPQKKFQIYFKEIQDSILFAKTPTGHFPLIQQIIKELKRADQSPHCLKNLENLRHKIRVQALFRKKVRSALGQIRVQSFILLILYIGLFLFVLQKYGWKYMQILLLSLFLFLIGLIWLFQCGRRIKWTI